MGLPPNTGNQQTASLIASLDGDGVNDVVITERTQVPALVWYRRTGSGWDRRIIEPGPLRVNPCAALSWAQAISPRMQPPRIGTSLALWNGSRARWPFW